MPMTPFTYPESYPKKIPPKAAKAHIRYALKVTGASMRTASMPLTGAVTAPPGMLKSSRDRLVGVAANEERAKESREKSEMAKDKETSHEKGRDGSL